MIKNSYQYSTTKSPVTPRSLKKPQEATRSLKKPQEASRSHKKPQEVYNVRLQELCCVFPQ